MISNRTFYRQFTDDTLLLWNDTKLESIKFVMDLIVPLAISCYTLKIFSLFGSVFIMQYIYYVMKKTHIYWNYLSIDTSPKRSGRKHTCSWRDKLIVSYLTRYQKVDLLQLKKKVTQMSEYYYPLLQQRYSKSARSSVKTLE